MHPQKRNDDDTKLRTDRKIWAWEPTHSQRSEQWRTFYKLIRLYFNHWRWILHSLLPKSSMGCHLSTLIVFLYPNDGFLEGQCSTDLNKLMIRLLESSDSPTDWIWFRTNTNSDSTMKLAHYVEFQAEFDCRRLKRYVKKLIYLMFCSYSLFFFFAFFSFSVFCLVRI